MCVMSIENSQEKPLVAVFGGTGGCANSFMTLALVSKYHVRALARNPLRLQEMLLSQVGISQKILDEQLVVIKGDATDKKAVRETLLAQDTNGNGSRLVSFVFFGIGGSPVFKLSLRSPLTVDNPSVCEESMKAIASTLKEIRSEHALPYMAPSLVVISTTGISEGPEDVPFGLRWLYHNLLAVPHLDKRNLEQLVQSSHAETIVNNAAIIRCSLLSGSHLIDQSYVESQIKVGTSENPTIGYSICRATVGRWVFDNVLGSSKHPESEFRIVTLTT